MYSNNNDFYRLLSKVITNQVHHSAPNYFTCSDNQIISLIALAIKTSANLSDDFRIKLFQYLGQDLIHKAEKLHNEEQKQVWRLYAVLLLGACLDPGDAEVIQRLLQMQFIESGQLQGEED